MITRRVLLVLAMGLVVGAPDGARAADYPARPIEIVVPYAPGAARTSWCGRS